MIRSKSELEKKIIETNDNNIFSIVPKTPIGIDYSNKDINENILKNNSSSKGLHKRDSSKEFKIGNYQIKQTLGEGTFGKVKLGIYIPTNEKVAIKIIEKDRMTDKDDVVRLKREFDMLSKFNHPNVILVTEIFESTDSYYSVMEYCEKGELFNYIVNKNRLSENETSFFYFQIINGLEYIHSLGIVHRDLKPENLLISKEHLLKIIDFGLSNYFTEGQTELLSTPCGSPCYASPEMVAGKKYDGMKIDVWSTGIILFAMLCGYLPFEDKNNDVLFDKILECKIEFPDFLSEDAKDLINKILVVDPEERITIKEIKKHKFYLKGKKFFDEIFTIKQIDAEDENNEIKNEENNGENINNKNEDATSNIKEDKDRNIENNNREENIDAKNKEIVYINEEKDDLNENKENINSNMNIVENTLPEETENIEKKRKINPKLKIEKNKNSEDLIPNGSNSSNRNNNNNNNNKITKKAKQLNNKYFQLIDKKLNQNQRKIDINDEPKENNFKRRSGTKKINSKIKKFEKDNEKKALNSIDINNNKSKINKKKLIIETLSKEKTINSIGSTGSSVAQTQKSNVTNLITNYINYNINSSFEKSKRNYSHENTKDYMTQKGRIPKNSNTINSNFNASNNNKTANENYVKAINNKLIEEKKDSKKDSNKSKYLSSQHINEKNENINKGKKIIHNKNNKYIKDSKTKIHSNNLDYQIPTKPNAEFNICKLIKGITSKKNKNQEFSMKQNKNNIISDKYSKTKIIRDKNFNTNRTNNFYEYKKGSGHKKNENYIRKIQSHIKNGMSLGKRDQSIMVKDAKNKNKKIFSINNEVRNKMNINNNKNMKSFDIINLQPIEFKIAGNTLQTESNKRNNNINSISKLPKNIKNKNLKINKVIDAQNKKIPNNKLSGNNLRKQKINKIPIKSIKTSNITSLFSTFNIEHYETINNVSIKYKNLKKSLVPNISNNSRTTSKERSHKKYIPISKKIKSNLMMNENLENNNYKLLIKKESRSINSKKNNQLTLNNTEILFNNMKLPENPKEKISKIKPEKNEIFIVNPTDSIEKNSQKEKLKLSKMNKYRNIFMKKQEEINHKNKRNKISSIKKIVNINPKIIKTYTSTYKKNKMSLSSKKNMDNRKIVKNNNMILTNIFKSNFKNKNKVKKVYIVKKDKDKIKNFNEKETK